MVLGIATPLIVCNNCNFHIFENKCILIRSLEEKMFWKVEDVIHENMVLNIN
jgi:hypothetical protein